MRRSLFRVGMTVFLAVGALLLGTAQAATSDRKGGIVKEDVRTRIVAEWEGGSITDSQLEEYAISRAGMAMRHGSDLTLEGLRSLLEELIGNKMLVEASQAPDVFSDPKFLGSYEIAAAQEIASRYVREILKDRFAVTDNEVAPFLPDRRETVRFKAVIVPTKEEAEEVLKRLKSGMPFDEAMEKYSQVKTAPGAVIDLRNTDDYLDGDARERIRSLSTGEISPVLPMKIGYGIALVLEKREMTGGEWKSFEQDKRMQLFQRKVAQHYDALQKKADIDLRGSELMLAAGEDFEFMTPRRVVMTVSGKPVHFDDYVRTRDTHLRDAMKIRDSKQMYNAYKLEFENLGITLALAREVASEKGWTEPPEDLKSRLRQKLALRVFGERLFDGIVVTDSEVRKEYDDNVKTAFTIRKRYKVRRVTFPTVEEARRFRKEVTSPEIFYRELRSRETKDDRFQNTYFEWQDAARLDEKSRKEFEKTRKGKLTDVIQRSPSQYQVFFVDDIQKDYRVPYEEVRIGIKRALLRRRQEEKLSAFVAGREKKHKMKIYDERLTALLKEMNRKRSELDPGHGAGPGGSGHGTDAGGSR